MQSMQPGWATRQVGGHATPVAMSARPMHAPVSMPSGGQNFSYTPMQHTGSYIPPPDANMQAPAPGQATQVVMSRTPVRRGMSPPPSHMSSSMSMNRLAPQSTDGCKPSLAAPSVPVATPVGCIQAPPREPCGTAPVMMPMRQQPTGSYVPCGNSATAPTRPMAHCSPQRTSRIQRHSEPVVAANVAAEKQWHQTTAGSNAEAPCSPNPHPREALVQQEAARDTAREEREQRHAERKQREQRHAERERDPRESEQLTSDAHRSKSRSSQYERKLQEYSTRLSESKHENKDLRRQLAQLKLDREVAEEEPAKLKRELRQIEELLEDRDEECAQLRARGDDATEAKRKQLERLQAQLDVQAQRVAEAERDLPDREREARRREAAQSEREASMSKREAALAEREAKLGEDRACFNADQTRFAEELEQLRVEQEERGSQLDAREAKLAQREADMNEQLGRQQQLKMQLEENESHHFAARQEAQTLRSSRRLSGGKENSAIKTQLEEQQDRMRDIKQQGWQQNRPETDVIA